MYIAESIFPLGGIEDKMFKENETQRGRNENTGSFSFDGYIK